MKTGQYLWEAAKKENRRALPILSFPAVQKMDITVRELTSDSCLQAKAMKIVHDLTPDSLASVSFMDLSVEAEAFGACARFSDDEVPTITGQLISDEEGAKALLVPSVGAGRTGVYVEAIRRAKELITDKPVFAGCIGPYSLAGRLMDVTEIMYLLYDEPDAVHTVLEKATEFLISYISAFKEAGADGVVIAEPLAGLLSPKMNREFSVPYFKRIVDTLQTEEFSVIYHNCGNTVMDLLDDIFSLNAAAYSFGDCLDMAKVLEKAPATALCLGNISPAGQFAGGTKESIYKETTALLQAAADKDNFIISSGCDIPPHARWENILSFFEAVRAFKA